MTEKKHLGKTLLLLAVVSLCLALLGSYALWEWGRNEGYWGNSDVLCHLSAQKVITSGDGLDARIVERSGHRGLLEKPRPQWLEVEMTQSASSAAPPTSSGLSAQLREKASSTGWTIDEECAPELLWCARSTDEDGHSLFMTVTPSSQHKELNSPPMESGKSDHNEIAPTALRVRIQYL